jgi:hypothetical protein
MSTTDHTLTDAEALVRELLRRWTAATGGVRRGDSEAALQVADWLAAHDAEVARAAAKEAGERIAQAIEAQESCASPAGECYRDHEGCYVADSLRIAREEGR